MNSYITNAFPIDTINIVGTILVLTAWAANERRAGECLCSSYCVITS